MTISNSILVLLCTPSVFLVLQRVRDYSLSLFRFILWNEIFFFFFFLRKHSLTDLIIYLHEEKQGNGGRVKTLKKVCK
jgi:hypothetical protein